MSNAKSGSTTKALIEFIYRAVMSALSPAQKTIKTNVFPEESGSVYDLDQMAHLEESSATNACVHATVNKFIKAFLVSVFNEYLDHKYNKIDSEIVITIDRIASNARNFPYIDNIYDKLTEFVVRTKNSQQITFPKLSADAQKAIDNEDYLNVICAVILVLVPCYVKKVPANKGKPTQPDPMMVANSFVDRAVMSGCEYGQSLALARKLFVPQTRTITDKALTDKSSNKSKSKKKEKEPEVVDDDVDETEGFM